VSRRRRLPPAADRPVAGNACATGEDYSLSGSPCCLRRSILRTLPSGLRGSSST
jgi:hypothetical protein